MILGSISWLPAGIDKCISNFLLPLIVKYLYSVTIIPKVVYYLFYIEINSVLTTSAVSSFLSSLFYFTLDFCHQILFWRGFSLCFACIECIFPLYWKAGPALSVCNLYYCTGPTEKDLVSDHALITWLSCIAHVACHAVITWLSCTTHLADHAMIM